MNAARWLGIALMATVVAGCDDAPHPTKVSVTTTTTRPAATQPIKASIAATEPSVADVQAKSLLTIDGAAVEFPRTRLRVKQTQPKLVVMLFSDDPKTAIDENYQGNSYYFEMALTCNDPAQLGTLMWNYQAASSEHVDSMNGVFLNGGKTHLQPVDAHVQFVQMGDKWMVSLSGQFLQFNSKDNSAVSAVKKVVSGALTAELEK